MEDMRENEQFVALRSSNHRRRWVVICALLLGIAVTVVTRNAIANSSINRSEYLSVNGARLYIQTRGANPAAPILLWLHGGPGGAERPLFRYFNGQLEKHFLVAYWDQRGAGRSFDAKSNPQDVTVAQHITDLDQVVDHLRRTFGQDKIVLMGHSWGAALGLLYTQAHADKVSALVLVNPLISMRQTQRAEYDFVQAEATRRHDETALAQLGKIGTPPYMTSKQALAMEKVVQRYGGIFHTQPNRMWVVFRATVAGLVRPWEIARFIRGNNVSLEAMHQELLNLNLTHSVLNLDVPVVMFLGRYDRHTDSRLSAAYFDSLRATQKKVIWFEESAHNVPFEQPGLFNTTVVRELEAIGILVSDRVSTEARSMAEVRSSVGPSPCSRDMPDRTSSPDTALHVERRRGRCPREQQVA